MSGQTKVNLALNVVELNSSHTQILH